MSLGIAFGLIVSALCALAWWLWPRYRLLWIGLGLFVILGLISTLATYTDSFFYPVLLSPDSLRYFHSAVAQAMAAMLAISFTALFVAMQLAHARYPEYTLLLEQVSKNPRVRSAVWMLGLSIAVSLLALPLVSTYPYDWWDQIPAVLVPSVAALAIWSMFVLMAAGSEVAGLLGARGASDLLNELLRNNKGEADSFDAIRAVLQVIYGPPLDKVGKRTPNPAGILLSSVDISMAVKRCAKKLWSSRRNEWESLGMTPMPPNQMSWPRNVVSLLHILYVDSALPEPSARWAAAKACEETVIAQLLPMLTDQQADEALHQLIDDIPAGWSFADSVALEDRFATLFRAFQNDDAHDNAVAALAPRLQDEAREREVTSDEIHWFLKQMRNPHRADVLAAQWVHTPMSRDDEPSQEKSFLSRWQKAVIEACRRYDEILLKETDVALASYVLDTLQRISPISYGLKMVEGPQNQHPFGWQVYKTNDAAYVIAAGRNAAGIEPGDGLLYEVRWYIYLRLLGTADSICKATASDLSALVAPATGVRACRCIEGVCQRTLPRLERISSTPWQMIEVSNIGNEPVLWVRPLFEVADEGIDVQLGDRSNLKGLVRELQKLVTHFAAVRKELEAMDESAPHQP